MPKIYTLLRLKKLLIADVERLSAFKKCKVYKLRGITEILKFSSVHFTQCVLPIMKRDEFLGQDPERKIVFAFLFSRSQKAISLFIKYSDERTLQIGAF